MPCDTVFQIQIAKQHAIESKKYNSPITQEASDDRAYRQRDKYKYNAALQD